MTRCAVDTGVSLHRRYGDGVGSTWVSRVRNYWLVTRVGVALVALSGLVVAPPASSATTLTYLALGDSYASGEGLAPFVGTNADHCDRSVESYPYLVATALGVTTAAPSFRDVACAGAKMSDLFLSVNGDASQASALTRGTDVASLTIGGNDVGFGPLAVSCLQLGALTTLATFHQMLCRDAIARAEQLLGAVRTGVSFATSLRARYHSRFVSTLLATLARLRAQQGTTDPAAGTKTWLVVVNYPVLLPPQRRASTPCQFGFGVTMSAHDASALRAINELLNAEILSTTRLYAQRHRDPGVVAVDVARSLQPLTCTTAVGASDVRSIDPANPSYSLHPLASGQQKMAALVTAALVARGLALSTPTTTSSTSTTTTTTIAP